MESLEKVGELHPNIVLAVKTRQVSRYIGNVISKSTP